MSCFGVFSELDTPTVPTATVFYDRMSHDVRRLLQIMGNVPTTICTDTGAGEAGIGA